MSPVKTANNSPSLKKRKMPSTVITGAEQDVGKRRTYRIHPAVGRNHYMAFGWFFLFSLQANIKPPL